MDVAFWCYEEAGVTAFCSNASVSSMDSVLCSNHTFWQNISCSSWWQSVARSSTVYFFTVFARSFHFFNSTTQFIVRGIYFLKYEIRLSWKKIRNVKFGQSRVLISIYIYSSKIWTDLDPLFQVKMLRCWMQPGSMKPGTKVTMAIGWKNMELFLVFFGIFEGCLALACIFINLFLAASLNYLIPME